MQTVEGTEIVKVNSFAELDALDGIPVPVSIFAFLAERNPHTIRERIARGTLPGVMLGGLICVLVNEKTHSKLWGSQNGGTREDSTRPLPTAGKHAVSRHRLNERQTVKQNNKSLGVLGVLGLGVAGAVAQVAPDPATLVTTATTAANSVMTLCLTVGGFFLVYKIVKWVRK